MSAQVLSQIGSLLQRYWSDFLIIALFVGFLSDGSWQRALGIASFAVLCLLIGGVIGLNVGKTMIQQMQDQWIKQQQQSIQKSDGTIPTVLNDVMELKPGQAKIYRCTRISSENGMRSTTEFIAMEIDDFDHILQLARLTRSDVPEKTNG